IFQRQGGLHGSGSSSVKVSRVYSGSCFGSFSWVAMIRATWSSSARMPASTTPSSNAFAPEMLASRSGSRRLDGRSEEHTSELQSRENLVCRLLLEKKKE